MLSEKLKAFRKTPEFIALITTLLYGLFVHMFGITNVIHNYDDIWVQPQGVGTTLASGRWFLKDLETLGENTTGNFNLPWFDGIFLILILSCATAVMVSILKIKNKWFAGVFGAAFVSFPTITVTLFFKFTAPQYGLSILLSVCSVWVTDRWRYGFLPGIFLLALSTGIYQAYFPLAVSLFLIVLIKKALEKETGFLTVLKKGLLYLGTMGGGLAAYLVILKIYLKIENVNLGSYQGINNMGNISLREMPHLILKAIKNVLLLPVNDYCRIAASSALRALYLIVGVISIILVVCIVIKNRKKPLEIAAIGVLCLLLPVAINSISLMGAESVYTLMILPFFFLMCIPLVLWELLEIDAKFLKIGTLSQRIVMGVVALMVFYNSYYANVNYTAMYYTNRRVENTVTAMATQIYQQEQYTSDKKWAFIGYAGNKAFSTRVWGKEVLYTGNPHPTSLVNCYSKGRWFSVYLGRAVAWADEKECQQLKGLPEVEMMPTWPDNGSIKVVGDYVVIKLG